MTKRNARRLRQCGADGGGHERRGAGRGNQGRQNAGEKRRAIAVSLGQAIANPGQSAADFKYTREVQADRHQEIDHERDEQRRLQLKAPTDLLAAGAQHQQHDGQREHRADDAGREYESLHANRGRMLLRMLDQADGLDRQHRKHAGHQIEDQPAEDGEQHEHRQGGSVPDTGAAPAAAEARGANRAGAATGAPPRDAAPGTKSAAISRGTGIASLPLCSVASNTPRMGPLCGGW